jgi:hypothetical protein
MLCPHMMRPVVYVLHEQLIGYKLSGPLISVTDTWSFFYFSPNANMRVLLICS